MHKTIKTKKGKTMDSNPSPIEPVTMTEMLELASWQRERSSDELLSFISQREAATSGK
jgi:hypothetical protein